MVKEHGKEMNKQRGSATVEAVVGFTAFLFAIFTILGLVNFCRAQMLVSSAVDTAAKELAQYSYFYEMSGLKKFEKTLDGNASVGKNNINEVIGTVDTLYSSISGAVDQTVQEKTNVANMVAAGEVDFTALENSVTGLANSAKGVKQGIAGVSNALKDVGNDPLLYMRSIVALIGSEGMEAAKRAVAVPLAKAFVSKHFGDSDEEVKRNLESLGIEGGLDSMNFNLSNVFSDANHQDIELVVIYKVKLLQVFDWVVLEANVSKVAHCRAWLGGDDVITKAVSTPQPSLGTTETPTGGEPSGDTDTTEAKDTETTDDVEIGEVDASVSGSVVTGTTASTGNWSLQHDPTGYYHSKRYEAFQDQFEEDYFIDSFTPTFKYHATDGKAVGYDFDVAAVWEYEAYENLNGDIVDPGVNIMKTYVEFGIKDMAETYTNENGEVQEFGAYTHIIYVPENMPQEQYNALEEDAGIVKAEMEALIQNDTTGIPKDLQVSIVIVRAGGQYDYNSKESDYVHIGGTE